MSFRWWNSIREWEQAASEELRFHIEQQTAANIAAGMTPEDARRQAVLQLGAVEGVKEAIREQRRGFWLETLAADMRYALRMLRKNPGFTCVVVLTLAFGIGANTAIFSVLDAVILKPLPYPQADRVALIWTDLKSAGQTRAPFSAPDMFDIERRSRLIQSVGGIWVGSAALTGTGEPEQIRIGLVMDDFLTVLGVPPARGRLFVAQDALPGAATSVILSDGLWRRRFGADPSIIGHSAKIDGQECTVIGVMPESFRLIFPPDAGIPPDVQAWAPYPHDPSIFPRDLNFLRVIARLRAGVTYSQASQEVASIAAQLRAENVANSKQGEDFEILPLQRDAIREIRPALLALFAGVGFVLLIACTNVANLLLSRAETRCREIALRTALGATRSRIVRQLLTETLLLALFGGAAGLLLGWWGMHWVLSLRPKSLGAMEAVHFNLTVLGYAFLVSLAAGILFGLAPAAESSRMDLVDTLRSGGKGLVSGKGRFRRLLVAVEVALGFVLLIGSGLMVRTFASLTRVDPGFLPDRLLTFQIAPPGARYPKDADRVRLFEQLRKNIAAVPGVESAGAVSHLPFDDSHNWYSYYWREGAPLQDQNTLLADHRAVTPGYFHALGAPFIAGRDFDDSDDLTRRRVIIVDDLLARRTWPGESAVGKKLNVELFSNGNFSPGPADVIGVVKHVRSLQLTEEGRPQVYEPYAQSPREQLAFVVRSSGAPESLAGAIRAEVDKIDRDLALAKVRPMNAFIHDARAATRFTMLLAGALAVLALALASIGIYGVTAYSVAQRRNEIGIRRALGAQPREVLALVVSQGMVSVLAGIVLGSALSFLLTPALSSLLFGVRPSDFATFSGVAVFLCLVGLLACYVPARRAARVDPMTALRYE
ncbi:MAG TPA: ABC transporter permease [Candidatus Sulfotelmatobacter sp.]|nr:ABC transporter permease [Candidatus Sulfotelmatobacter sp.]